MWGLTPTLSIRFIFMEDFKNVRNKYDDNGT